MPTVAPKEFDLLRDLNRQRKRTVQLPGDAELVARHTKNPKLLLSRMAAKGLLRRIQRGRYLVVGPGGGTLLEEASPYAIIDGALSPRRYAVSFLSALSYYGLSDHEPFDVTLLLDERRDASPPTELAGISVRARVDRRDDRWFGIRIAETRGGSFQIADPERAIIDSLDRPSLGGGPETVVRALARGLRSGELRLSRLRRHALRHSVRVARRLGYLLELLDAASEGDLAQLATAAKRSHRTDTLFGLSGERDDDDVPRDSRWCLRIDIPPEMISGWAAYEAVA